MDALGIRRKAVCTIISPNYFHFAKTLMDSMKRVHPSWERYVLLVDNSPEEREGGEDSFQLITVGQLSIPNPSSFFFRYDILEANTAVKPWLFDWLFKQGVDQVVYLDPDIAAFSPFEEVEKALDEGSLLVLTPHLVEEVRDRHQPSELAIIRAGSYNLGFLAVARHSELPKFLRWWQRKLVFDCRNSQEEGVFVDQKWMELVPGLFDSVHILRHPGYNVAYWNLGQRKVEQGQEGYTVNGAPLRFFHFSGLNPENPWNVSKYQDRFRLEDLDDTRQVIEEYCKAIQSNELEKYRHLPYGFDYFADGTTIPAWVRKYFRKVSESRGSFGGDPFQKGIAYLNEPWSSSYPLLTRMVQAAWEMWPEVQSQFPDPMHSSRVSLFFYFIREFAPRHNLPEVFLQPMRRDLLSLQRVGRLHHLRRVLRPAIRMFPTSWRHNIKSRIKSWLQRGSAPAEGIPSSSLVSSAYSKPSRTMALGGRFGMNIAGYVLSEHGIGESARRCAAAALEDGLSISLHDYNAGNTSRTSDSSLTHLLSKRNQHFLNLIHVNADQMPLACQTLGEKFFQGRYNIGYWHWELPEFPDEWTGSFSLVNEVWAPTFFVVDSILRKSTVPVLRFPHAVHFRVDANDRRARFDLPDDRFLFLSMYDTHSVQARKNPRAALEAFRRAFPHDQGVGLVVKINNPDSYPEEVRALKQELAGEPNIFILDRILSRQDVYQLESLCNAFVSLHRSEGFGLGLAESMFLGKPCIGTGWSGNMDFMTSDNSCPVRYQLTRIEQDHGPYKKGQVWAEPEIDHAAWYMRKLVEDQLWREQIAAQGQKTIHTDFSPKTVGQMYRQRMECIARREGVPIEKIVAPKVLRRSA